METDDSILHLKSVPALLGALKRCDIPSQAVDTGPAQGVSSSSLLTGTGKKAFGLADSWPAEGRPAGGSAQEGIDGWRDGGKSAVSAIPATA